MTISRFTKVDSLKALIIKGFCFRHPSILPSNCQTPVFIRHASSGIVFASIAIGLTQMLCAVFNGYFRSGTTLFWNILRLSNPDADVFYEPFHTELFVHLSLRQENPLDPLHQLPVFNTYFKYPDFISKLRKYFPNYDQPFPLHPDLTFKYLNLFNELPNKVILQANRLHFLYDEISTNFPNCKIIHIIRHPLDIYLSIITIHKKYYSHLSLGQVFYTDDIFRWIYSRFGLPKLTDSRRDLIFNDFLAKILSCWIIANYHALLITQDNYNILVIRYEDLITKKEIVSQKVFNFCNINFDISCVTLKSQKIHKYNKALEEKCKLLIDFLGLAELFNFINSKVKYF